MFQTGTQDGTRGTLTRRRGPEGNEFHTSSMGNPAVHLADLYMDQGPTALSRLRSSPESPENPEDRGQQPEIHQYQPTAVIIRWQDRQLPDRPTSMSAQQLLSSQDSWPTPLNITHALKISALRLAGCPPGSMFP